MKTISIMQPWASLIVGWIDSKGIAHPGPKGIENRSWRPPKELIGQQIAIHASKREDDSIAASVRSMHMFSSPDATVALPKSAIVGVATLVGVVDSMSVMHADDRAWYAGEIGLVLRDRVMLRQPVACKGALGFWKLPPDVEAKVRVQLTPITDLIDRSSIGTGLRNIRDNGIDAELADLERGRRQR